jgi:hypothetical protein
VLSNAIMSMPTADRAAAAGTATVYFRCGSQAGKPAATVSAELSQGELDELTVAFVAAEIETYRRAVASKQKNASRNLKKYFDKAHIARIDRGIVEGSTTETALLLLT